MAIKRQREREKLMCTMIIEYEANLPQALGAELPLTSVANKTHAAERKRERKREKDEEKLNFHFPPTKLCVRGFKGAHHVFFRFLNFSRTP